MAAARQRHCVLLDVCSRAGRVCLVLKCYSENRTRLRWERRSPSRCNTAANWSSRCTPERCALSLSSPSASAHPPSPRSAHPLCSQKLTALLLSLFEQDLDRWRMHLCDAIARAKVDARASRPLPCTPLVVKERALSGVPGCTVPRRARYKTCGTESARRRTDCFRGVVWFKLSGGTVLLYGAMDVLCIVRY